MRLAGPAWPAKLNARRPTHDARRIILALAMIINLFVAGLAGTLIPLGLKALKVDPALASTVFITTFTDVCGFAAFLGLAAISLRMSVHPG
jgi:Mg/Co/Ni transporter MgtE